MSHLKSLALRVLVAVSAMFILSSTALAAWPVKIDHGYAQALAVDHAGNVIAAGSLSGPTLDVYKLSGRDGSVIWSYRYHGIASKVAVDLNGDVVVGSYWGALIKISGVNGAQLWLVSEFESVTGVKTDEEGNVFAVGRGNGRFKAVKVDADGRLIWRYLSRPGVTDNGLEPSHDTAYALALGLDGDVIAAGVRDQDFTLVKISGQHGIEVGQQKIDGPGNGSHFFEKAVAVAVGADGSVFAGGSTSPDFKRNEGPSSFTVAKFSGDLAQRLWFSEIEGKGSFIDEANDLTLDPAGDVVAAGVLFNTYWRPDGTVIWTGDQFAVVKLSGQTGEVIWNELADYDHQFYTRGIGYAVTTNARGDVFATGLFAEAFMVVRKFAEDGKNMWRRQETDALVHGVGYAVTLDAQQAVIAAGQNTTPNRNKFTVLKLDPATGLDYVSDVPETVRKYAPMVYLHPDEDYRPGDPMRFISRSELRWSHQATAGGFPCGDHGEVGRGAIDAGRLGEASSSPYTHNPRDTSNPFCRHFEDIKLKASDHTRPFDGSKRDNILGELEGYMKEGFYLAPPEDSNLRAGIGDGAPVFYEYVKGKYVTYWFFYPYNLFRIENPEAGYSIPSQQHEGDWERVSIQLDENDSPVNVLYYAHHDGTLVPWSRVDKFDGTHPIVFSAKGSHGSFPVAGEFPTDACIPVISLCALDRTDYGPRWLTWTNLWEVEAQPWYGFGGAWGEVGEVPSEVIGVGLPVHGAEFTGPLGPSKYKNSRNQWLLTIGGRVTGINGSAMGGVQMILADAQRGEAATTLTDETGRYVFAGLTFGRSYTIIPSMQNSVFSPLFRSLFDLRGNQTADFRMLDTTPPVINLPPDITVNAESPQGATVYYSVSATDDETMNPRVACAPQSGALFPTGTTTVSCEAIDDAGNRATGTFKVTVKGAAEQITELIVAVKSFNLERGVENSLVVKLQHALSQVTAGNRAAGCNQLRAFINHVQALTGKKLSVAQANQTVISVNRIIAASGC